MAERKFPFRRKATTLSPSFIADARFVTEIRWHQSCHLPSSQKNQDPMLIERQLAKLRLKPSRTPGAASLATALALPRSAGLGFEFDVMRYQHFFKDAEVFPADPAAPPNCRPGSGGDGSPARTSTRMRRASWATWWCPYAFKARRSYVPTGLLGSG